MKTNIDTDFDINESEAKFLDKLIIATIVFMGIPSIGVIVYAILSHP